MSENKEKDFEKLEGITGHVWDEDLCEYNNPLPRWWLMAFYGTVIFSIGYWILFPTWPLPNSYTKGFYTLKVEDEGITTDRNWNSRVRLANELQTSPEAQNRTANLKKLSEMKPAEILQDPKMIQFARAVGKVTFGDNCATCHNANAQGQIGMYPNLTDNAWLWGGKLEQIEETITRGRKGNMTPAKPEKGPANMTDDQILDVSKYALSLSGNYSGDEEALERGEKLFYGRTPNACHTCHVNYASGSKEAKGNPLMGAPDLTDNIWEIVDINSMTTPEEKLAAIIPHVENGVVPDTTHREMPSWKDRLTKEQIRALAVYVHQLGGGQ